LCIHFLYSDDERGLSLGLHINILQNIEIAANLLKALSNEKRLLIVCALYNTEKCVGDLEKIVGISQSALSQHLARLRREGLVKTRRSAQTIYYSIDDSTIKTILECLYDIYSPNDSDKT
jgi:ArsR family transcriptional regulator, virulence genes transcriptional regulator